MHSGHPFSYIFLIVKKFTYIIHKKVKYLNILARTKVTFNDLCVMPYYVKKLCLCSVSIHIKFYKIRFLEILSKNKNIFE